MAKITCKYVLQTQIMTHISFASFEQNSSTILKFNFVTFSTISMHSWMRPRLEVLTIQASRQVESTSHHTHIFIGGACFAIPLQTPSMVGTPHTSSSSEPTFQVSSQVGLFSTIYACLGGNHFYGGPSCCTFLDGQSFQIQPYVTFQRGQIFRSHHMPNITGGSNVRVNICIVFMAEVHPLGPNNYEYSSLEGPILSPTSVSLHE